MVHCNGGMCKWADSISMHTQIPITQTLDSAPSRTVFWGNLQSDKKCRFWCLSKPDSDLGLFGPHSGVIRWGGLHVGVMCPFCTRSEKHPHVGTHEKQGQRLAYTLPTDTVDLQGVHELWMITQSLEYSLCASMGTHSATVGPEQGKRHPK